MPGSPAIRFALAGAVLGVLGAGAAFALTGGESSAPAATPEMETVTHADAQTTASTATVTTDVEVTVATIAAQTLTSYSFCRNAAEAVARQAQSHDGSPAELGTAALTAAERCSESTAVLSGEVEAAGGSEKAAAAVEAVAAYAALAEKQTSAATKLAPGLASGSRSASKRAARSYASRVDVLDRSARRARRELDRVLARAG
jgi:hypothetical protein